MKKLNFFAVAAVAIMSVFGLSSCEKEDIPAPTPDPTPEEVKVSDRTGMLFVTQDMLEVLDFEVVTEINGKSETKVITSSDFAEVSDMEKYKALVEKHNSRTTTDTDDDIDITIRNASDLKKYYKVYECKFKDVKKGDNVSVAFNAIVKNGVTDATLRKKNAVYAHALGYVNAENKIAVNEHHLWIGGNDYEVEAATVEDLKTFAALTLRNKIQL